MRVKKIFKFFLRFLFCAAVIVLSVKSLLDNKKQREAVIRNWEQLLTTFHINSPRLLSFGKTYHFNAIIVLNVSLIFLAGATLLGKGNKFGYFLLAAICQFVFINNPIFEKKSGIIMMCSAYAGLFSLLMR